jgi:hypothetical protein
MSIQSLRIPSLALCGLLLPTLALAGVDSPWLGVPGTLNIEGRYIFQTADELFAGDVEVPLPGDLELSTYGLRLDYTVNERVAVDLIVGYAESDFLAPGDFDGFSDTRIGVNYVVHDEFTSTSGAPTLTLRAVGIIAGDYDTGSIEAIGDGASGFEIAALVGKQFTNGLALYGELGYRNRSDGVPDDTFLEVNAWYAFNSTFSAGVGYFVNRADGDLDIGGPGFSEPRFPEVDEDIELIRVGASINVAPNWQLGFDAGRVIDGANTPKSDVYSVSLGYTL